MRKLISLLILFIFLPLFNIAAVNINSATLMLQEDNNGQSDIQTLPKGVSIHQLDNGLKVVLIQNPALPMVGVNVVIKVGSAYETFATSGMSHMLEHLLFNGTTTMTQKELYDAVDKIGGYNNANTDMYYTNFMLVTPAENIFEGMKLQADMLFNSTLPDEKFGKEKGIVMEEIAKSIAKPIEQAERNVISIIYDGHALSLPTTGTYETIKSMKRDDVFKFYKNYYVPNNMVMSVIGNFNSKEMLDKIKEIYGGYAPGIVKYPESDNWATGFEKVHFKTDEQEVYYRFYNGKEISVSLWFPLPDNLSLDFYHLMDMSLNLKQDSLRNKLNEKFDNSIANFSFDLRNLEVISYLGVNFKLQSDDNLGEIISTLKDEIKALNFALPRDAMEAEKVTIQTKYYKNVEKPHMFGIFNANKFAQYGIESVFASYSGKGFDEAYNLLSKFKITSAPKVIVQYPLSGSEKEVSDVKIETKLFDNGDTKPVVIARQNKMSELLAVHYLIKNKAPYESMYGKDAAFIWHDAFGQRMKSPEVKKESMQYGFTFTVNDNPYIPMDNIYLSPAFGYIRVEGLAGNVEGAINFLNQQMLNFIPTEDEFNNAVNKLKGVKMMQQGRTSNNRFVQLYKKIIYEPEKYKEPANEITYDSLLLFGKDYFNPSNMIISVVSPASPDEINNYFLSFTTNTSSPMRNEPPFMRGYKDITEPITVTDSVGGEQAHIFYGFIKNITP